VVKSNIVIIEELYMKLVIDLSSVHYVSIPGSFTPQFWRSETGIPI